jgi:hypothetical protein
MAKLNKIMPPRNTTIRGQDHLLAYITPEEAALLKARGGSGEPGPMGIPQYGYGDDDGGGYGDGDSDTGGMGSGDPDTGGFGGGGYGEDPGFDGGGGGSAQTETVSLGGSSGGGDSYAPQSLAPEKRYGASRAKPFRTGRYFDYSNIFDPSVYSSKRIGGDFFDGSNGGWRSTMTGTAPVQASLQGKPEWKMQTGFS